MGLSPIRKLLGRGPVNIIETRDIAIRVIRYRRPSQHLWARDARKELSLRPRAAPREMSTAGVACARFTSTVRASWDTNPSSKPFNPPRSSTLQTTPLSPSPTTAVVAEKVMPPSQILSSNRVDGYRGNSDLLNFGVFEFEFCEDWCIGYGFDG